MLPTLLQSNLDALSHQPSSLTELGAVVNLHRRLVEEKKKAEARFDPLR